MFKEYHNKIREVEKDINYLKTMKVLIPKFHNQDWFKQHLPEMKITIKNTLNRLYKLKIYDNEEHSLEDINQLLDNKEKVC